MSEHYFVIRVMSEHYFDIRVSTLGQQASEFRVIL